MFWLYRFTIQNNVLFTYRFFSKKKQPGVFQIVQTVIKIQESYEKQFNTWDWTYGQSPEYTVERNVRYPAGKISTYANVENSVIKSVKIYGDFFGIGDVSDIEDLLVGVPYEYEDVLAKLKTIDTTHYFSRMTTEEVAKAIVA